MLKRCAYIASTKSNEGSEPRNQYGAIARQSKNLCIEGDVHILRDSA